MESVLNPTLIALISVVTTGLVSVLSIFVPVIIETRKARQSSISSERDRLETATLDLLREISHFRRPIQFDIENSSGRPMQQAISDMRVKNYAWERAIWHKITDEHQEQVKALRQKFESLSSDRKLGELAEQLPNITDEILTLTRIASDHF